MQPDTRRSAEPHSVVLPVSNEQFREFIKGLLGRPQALSKPIEGSFDVDRIQIRQVNELLHQRIQEQNDACLAQFEATLSLSDNENKEFQTLEDLLSYNAPRKVSSGALSLTWDYLVKFQDKGAYEKQRIQIRFRTDAYLRTLPNERGDAFASLLSAGLFSLLPRTSIRVEYTARSWGEDIESLLTRYLESITNRPAGFSRFVIRNSGKVAFSLAALVYASVIYGCFIATWNLSQSGVARVTQTINEGSTTDMLATLLMLHAEGIWTSHILLISVILVVAMPFTVALASWTYASSIQPKPSFLRLTAEDDNLRSEMLRKYDRRIRRYILSLAANVIAGVLANCLFRWLF